MSVDLLALALVMAVVTYPSRAVPLLVPRFEQLPPFVLAYLRLVGPAMLASLAAAGVLFVTGERGIRIGVELVAVGVCVAIVAWRGSLLVGILAAVGLVALVRAAGLA